jgi:hypothetical protein
VRIWSRSKSRCCKARGHDQSCISAHYETSFDKEIGSTLLGNESCGAAFDGDAVRWIGVTLFAAGRVLRLWPVFVLGRRFSGLVAIQPEHTLVTGGVYGVIRIRAISAC